MKLEAIGRGINIRVRGFTGQERPYGKIVRYSGAHIFHEHVTRVPQRYSSLSWGINRAVADFLAENGVHGVYLYLKSRNITFHVELDLLLFAAKRDRAPGWGIMLNLPEDQWEMSNGALPYLPFIPSDRVVVIDAEQSSQPALEGEQRELWGA